MPQTPAAVTIRALTPEDLDAVVAIDAGREGHSRRVYVERRLAAARREPALHAQLAAVDERGLAGHILARVLAGEFGRNTRVLRLETMGVRADLRRAGVGRALFDALMHWASRHGCTEVRTASSWRDHQVLAWFDALGFEVAPEWVVDVAVSGLRDEPVELAHDTPREVNYGGDDAANDHDRLARDIADVRAMTPADLDAIAAIDRRITGADRRDYIGGRLAEAMLDGGVRVSLCARCDGTPAGYLMARADLGDYGRTEPVAVIDTIGVHPEFTQRGIGAALLSQLFANLGALRVERVETLLRPNELALAGFLNAAGFAPSQRLAFVRRL